MHLQTNRLVEHLKHFHWPTPQPKQSVSTPKPARQIKIPLVALCVGLALVVSFFLGTQFANRPTTWEYNFIKMDSPNHVLELYQLGEDGWQVAGFFHHWQGNQTVLVQRPHRKSLLKAWT